MAEGIQDSGIPYFSGNRQNSGVRMGATLSESHNRCSSKFGNSELCSLCKKRPATEQDHDHRSDLCRGMVCHSCNLLIARFDRPVEEIQHILDYIALWSAEHAAHGGRSYTEWMREAFPKWRHSRHDIPKTQDEVA
jgi:recombination endonuclease VII